MDNARKKELLKNLVAGLCDERGMESPRIESSDELWVAFRALVNTRLPIPADPKWLSMQDELLQGMIDETGITRVESIPPVSVDSRIRLWRGDITTLAADAIVNAANSQMLGCWVPGHHCIDNAIHTFAGVQLRIECARIVDAQGHEEPTGMAKEPPKKYGARLARHARAQAAGGGGNRTGGTLTDDNRRMRRAGPPGACGNFSAVPQITSAYNLPAKHVIHTVGPIANGCPTNLHRAQLALCYRSCLNLAAENGLRSIAFCCISTGIFGFPQEEAACIAVRTVREWLDESALEMTVVFNVFSHEDESIYGRLLS